MRVDSVAVESLVLLRLRVEVQEITARFLESLGAVILIVATGGCEPDEICWASEAWVVKLRELLLLLLSSAKTAEMTCEAKSSTDEIS